MWCKGASCHLYICIITVTSNVNCRQDYCYIQHKLLACLTYFVHKLWHLHGEKRQIWIISCMRSITYHKQHGISWRTDHVLWTGKGTWKQLCWRKTQKQRELLYQPNNVTCLANQSVTFPFVLGMQTILSHPPPPNYHPTCHTCMHAHTQAAIKAQPKTREREKREATYMWESECDRESERGERWKLLTLVGPHSGYEVIQTKILETENKSNQINLYCS